MKRKPRGMKSRNLFKRGSSIVYERIWNGRRIKRSMGVDDWEDAAAIRDALEAKLGAGRLPRVECPTFAEAAEECLKAFGHLAPTTRQDREAMLAVEKVEDGKVVKPAGPLVQTFGAMRLDAIRRVHLLDWWSAFVENGGRSAKTGRNHLDALASVFGWGIDRELLDESPVEGLRAILRRRGQTKQGRSESQAGVKVHPIEKPEDVAALVAEAERVAGKPYLVTLILLDAGLRLGEATALGWEDVDLAQRTLRIRQSLSRGKHLGKTKSGRERRVAMSLRLRAALREAWIREGRPELGFVARVDHKNYRDGKTGTGSRRRLRPASFQAMCRAAGLGDSYTPKSLRDTYASHLLTAGVQLAYVSRQLGHADVAVTARHYARWCGDDYRRPLEVRDGKVPADLLSRLGESHQSPTMTRDGDTSASEVSA